MTLSRIAATLVLVTLPAAVPAQSGYPEPAYRIALPSIAEVDCPQQEDAEEIVVCGRRAESSPYRLPLPVAPEEGARVTDGAPSAVAAMGPVRERCSTVGPNQNCGGGLPVFGIAAKLIQLVDKVVDPEE